MTQFQTGKSGNPRGRPKGARNLKSQFLEAVNAPETGEPESGSKLQAAIKAQIAKAVQGDIRAIRDVMERVEKWEVERSGERAPNFTEADREVIAEIHRRLAPSSACAEASADRPAGKDAELPP